MRYMHCPDTPNEVSLLVHTYIHTILLAGLDQTIDNKERTGQRLDRRACMQLFMKIL